MFGVLTNKEGERVPKQFAVEIGKHTNESNPN